MLCACLPELGPIFLRQNKKAGPTTSIVNGRYRYRGSKSDKKERSLFSTGISKSMRGIENDTYFELEEGDYDAQATAQNRSDLSVSAQRCQPGEITITKEVRVATNAADSDTEQLRLPNRV